MPDSSKPQTAPAAKTLRLTEMYKSIQGESTWAGLPFIFIRLARCHLRCLWCDTAYAFYGGDSVPIDEIVARCSEMDCRRVEITGGEPLVQAECADLAQELLDRDYTVLVETSGTLPIRDLPAGTIKIMDLKCPGSGVCEQNDWSNIEALSPRDEVKFVITSRDDYEWSRDVVRRYNLPQRCHAVLFSPVFEEIEGVEIVQWIIEDGLDVRFQLQLHKHVWAPETKGV